MIRLLLGTNLGDRQSHLDRAVDLLSSRLGTALSATEALETEAVGFEGPPFLNMVVAFDPCIAPYALLELCQEIEIEMGRPRHNAEYDAEGRRIYRDRVIDIDILEYDGVSLETPLLRIPHPQVEERPFVAELLAMPLRQIEIKTDK